MNITLRNLSDVRDHENAIEIERAFQWEFADRKPGKVVIFTRAGRAYSAVWTPSRNVVVARIADVCNGGVL